MSDWNPAERCIRCGEPWDDGPPESGVCFFCREIEEGIEAQKHAEALAAQFDRNRYWIEVKHAAAVLLAGHIAGRTGQGILTAVQEARNLIATVDAMRKREEESGT